MDWLRDLQQSFREPVFGFFSTFWPVFAVGALIGLGWLFSSMFRRARSSSSGDSGGGGGDVSFGDSDGGGDGGGGD